MFSLANKKILLGVTGGIAAFKTPMLVRLLKKAGAEVQVLMTPTAHRFVTAETLATLSGNPVFTDFFSDSHGQWNNHVELGIWPDLIVVAPATSNSISKMAAGSADNLLLTTLLSARCPILLAPAMDLDMYEHESLQSNLQLLATRDYLIEEPQHGELASGLVGKGRMAEPEVLFNRIGDILTPVKGLVGKKVLITAGPTKESIDPVRFLSNHSTGKMGYAIAETFAACGAEVTLVSGPVQLQAPSYINTVHVESALEMQAACDQVFAQSDIVVMSAAVADYRPMQVAAEKIKKSEDNLTLQLVKNPDILAGMGKKKLAHQVLIGFALETFNETEFAHKKLQDKNLDMIVLNSLRDAGAGFGHDTNKITLISSNQARELPLKSKKAAALDIVEEAAHLLDQKIK
jgi:phosphopantothenoylcysteine decarboxylase / phosphopantothenate---cysteine ligase